MKTWPMEPCDPETSLRFHGDVAGFGFTPAGWLVHGRRQLWRWENYITHISAVIAYSNGNPLGSMGLNEEADMWELVATAWIGPSLGWRRFCGMQNSVSMQPRMGSIWKYGFFFFLDSRQPGFQSGRDCSTEYACLALCSIPPVNPHKHATTGAGLQFETWGCDIG